MTKRILINATQHEELRVAIVDVATQWLLDLMVERQSYRAKTGNIYMGVITAIEPSLDACFVNFGSERHGFLPFKEIVPHYFATDTNKSGRQALKDALKVGQKVMVQVEKEERGNKGAALTTFISLAGSYVVLMPDNPRAGGISRRVEGRERDELRESFSTLPIPDNMGLIVRTAGVGKAANELEWDLNALLKQWQAIQTAGAEHTPPFLVHQESDIVIRAIRDYLREEISEIWVDDATLYERIKTYLAQIRPEFVARLKLYASPIPLFNRYQIEHQIEAAHDREVRLPSGGSIVIGHTEALVAIDVNSGQATKGKDIEHTAFDTNMEAARVIACQLRLRDIGGLIVVDFIDMPSMRHRKEVENELRNALKLDKARTQVGTISPRFGLLEMSRQRLRHSLGEATRSICPRCDGWGSIRSIESLALSILRVIEEDAIRPGTAQIQSQLPVDIATFIMNEKRDVIANIEKNQKIQILLIPNAKLEAPHYRIRRLTESEVDTSKVNPSYRLVAAEEVAPLYKRGTPIKAAEEKPAVQNLYTVPTTDSTNGQKKAPCSLVKRLISSLFGADEKETNVVATPKPPVSSKNSGVRTPYPKSTQHSHQDRQGPRPPRAPRPPQTPRDKNTAKPFQQTATPSTTPPATTQAPSTPNQSAEGRPPRGPNRQHTGRNSNQQRRTISPRPPRKSEPQPTTPPAPLNPPDYLKTPVSDTDLESYYQESARFVDKKSSKPATPIATPPKIKDETLIADIKSEGPISSPVASAPIVPSPVVEPKADWVPHKIAPAASDRVIEKKEE